MNKGTQYTGTIEEAIVQISENATEEEAEESKGRRGRGRSVGELNVDGNSREAGASPEHSAPLLRKVVLIVSNVLLVLSFPFLYLLPRAFTSVFLSQ